MSEEDIFRMAVKAHLIMYDYKHPSLKEFAGLVEREVKQKAWVGLTDEEMRHVEETTTCLENESWLRNLTRNIESKLKEKNHANK